MSEVEQRERCAGCVFAAPVHGNADSKHNAVVCEACAVAAELRVTGHDLLGCKRGRGLACIV